MSTGAYTPPPRALDGHPINLEPARFAMTGGGFSSRSLRHGFELEANGHAIDAPCFIATGGIGGDLAVPTVAGLQPWHYLNTSVPREAT